MERAVAGVCGGVQPGLVLQQGLHHGGISSLGSGVEGGPASPAVALGERYSQAWLSLVKLLHYCALIGRELHSDATPALLCHKEPAQGTQSPLLGVFLAFHWFFMA